MPCLGFCSQVLIGSHLKFPCGVFDMYPQCDAVTPPPSRFTLLHTTNQQVAVTCQLRRGGRRLQARQHGVRLRSFTWHVLAKPLSKHQALKPMWHIGQTVELRRHVMHGGAESLFLHSLRCERNAEELKWWIFFFLGQHWWAILHAVLHHLHGCLWLSDTPP